LNDGGSGLFAQVVLALRRKIANIKIEVLVPDFKGQKEAVITVVEAGPLVLAHNLETVPRLYAKIRPQADYQRSLMLLQNAKIYGKIYSKSGLMLGLGESEDEVLKVLRDLRRVNCDFLNLGQYLSPGLSNYQVQEYVTPNKFGYFKEKAIEMGFLYVASAPYVRSSYLADEYFKNKGDSK
ncbi:MAG: lipoyl synthase, partial [Candidatus Omnitrophica bacterium]|nr:lipoyl synthase [Candidatus Omnitrophota bacterium]